MSNRLLLIIFSLSILCSCGDLKGGKKIKDGISSGKAVIELDSTVANYGTFPKSVGTISTSFHFTNTGDADLVFLDVDYSCGCVLANYPLKPIKPGKNGEVIVSYRTQNKNPGEFVYKVYFAINGSPSNIVLEVRGNMTNN